MMVKYKLSSLQQKYVDNFIFVAQGERSILTIIRFVVCIKKLMNIKCSALIIRMLKLKDVKCVKKLHSAKIDC